MLSIVLSAAGWALSKIHVPVGWLDHKIIGAAEWCFAHSRRKS